MLATYLNDAGKAHHELVARGQELSWQMRGPRRCIGIYNGQTDRRRLCPRRAAVSDGSQCAACKAADPGRLIAQDRASPSGIFRTYLALFGRNTVKVGLTAERRAVDRLLEQAAAAHVFVCSGTYKEARQAELLLSSGLGVPQHLGWRRKRELWSEETDAQQRADALAERAVEARTLLSQDGQAQVLPDGPVVDDTAHYGLTADALPRRRQVPTAVQEGDVAAGTILGTLGKLLVLDDRNDCLVLDTRALEGWIVTTAAPDKQTHFAVAPLVESSVQQESLFSF